MTRRPRQQPRPEAAGARFGFGLDWVDYDLGADRWLRTGEALPEAVLDELRGVDAILLGAVGRPDVPPGVLERGLLLRLRFELDLYVNLRPVKLYPGVSSPLADVKPDDIDLLVVRENTEGVYVGAGGTVKPFTYRTLGVFVDMGRFQAVASTAGIKWRGFPAWFLARTYHLALMPGNRRRLRLMADWTIGLLFGRDSAELGQLGHPPRLEARSAGGTAESANGRAEAPQKVRG